MWHWGKICIFDKKIRMKSLITPALLFFALMTFSQNNDTVTAPLIVSKIAINSGFEKGELKITFKEVITDSRCPSDVTCIWEGEAKIKVVIETNGNKQEKEFLFKGKNLGNEKEHLLFKTEKSIVVARQLLPYPLSTDAGIREYALEVYERVISKNGKE